MEKLDNAYLAILRYQRREYDDCIEVCSKILEKNPYDEAIWSLKTRALTAQVLYYFHYSVWLKPGVIFGRFLVSPHLICETET